MYPGFSFFLGILFITETCLWNTMLVSKRDLLCSDNWGRPGLNKEGLTWKSGPDASQEGQKQYLGHFDILIPQSKPERQVFPAQLSSASVDPNLCVPHFGLITWSWISVTCGIQLGLQQSRFGITAFGNGTQDQLIILIVLLALLGSPVFLELMFHKGGIS